MSNKVIANKVHKWFIILDNYKSQYHEAIFIIVIDFLPK